MIPWYGQSHNLPLLRPLLLYVLTWSRVFGVLALVRPPFLLWKALCRESESLDSVMHSQMFWLSFFCFASSASSLKSIFMMTFFLGISWTTNKWQVFFPRGKCIHLDRNPCQHLGCSLRVWIAVGRCPGMWLGTLSDKEIQSWSRERETHTQWEQAGRRQIVQGFFDHYLNVYLAF